MTALLQELPPGTRVSCPTAPWRLRQHPTAGPHPYVLHVVSYIHPHRDLPVGLCRTDCILEHHPAADQTRWRCTRCLYLVQKHGLWPL